MKVVTSSQLRQSLELASGQFDCNKLSLYTIVRDEMYFLPAFLDHYRSIGIEQFIILDDGSKDGSSEYLAAQSDCAVFHSCYAYGDNIIWDRPDHPPKETRAGTAFKNEIPAHLLPDRFALYLDVDEFLVLPPDAKHLNEVIDRLRNCGQACVAASVVEFFPKDFECLNKSFKPASFTELLAEYPYFDAEPVIKLRKERQPKITWRSKSRKLFETYGLCPVSRGICGKIARYFGWQEPRQGSPHLKTPILNHTATTFRIGSHMANVPPAYDMMLTLIHFIFTSNFMQKIERAQHWKSHDKKGRKYNLYCDLMNAMAPNNAEFADRHTQRFQNADQFIKAGLMKW